MQTALTLIAAAPQEARDVAANLRAIALLVGSLLLIFIGLYGMWTRHRSGDMQGQARTGGVILLAMFPIGLGLAGTVAYTSLGGGMAGFVQAVLGF